jgi:hypothetical protein
MEDQDCQSGSQSQSCAQTPSQTPSHSPAYNNEDLEMQQIELEDLYNKKALHAARSNRPENTKKAYIPRQKEWQVSLTISSYSTLYKRDCL